TSLPTMPPGMPYMDMNLPRLIWRRLADNIDLPEWIHHGRVAFVGRDVAVMDFQAARGCVVTVIVPVEDLVHDTIHDEPHAGSQVDRFALVCMCHFSTPVYNATTITTTVRIANTSQPSGVNGSNSCNPFTPFYATNVYIYYNTGCLLTQSGN